MFVELFEIIFKIILNFVQSFGYIGIFLMTFVESTFIPMPSEFTLIPAGYLVARGDMNILPVLLSSVLGALLGSLFNYFIAYYFGRKLFTIYGKYFFLNSQQLNTIELFFTRYGGISTLLGRMLPGIKHFISFPAGLAKMNLHLFSLYTTIGSFFWLSFLLYLGYVVGTNQQLISTYIKKFNLIIVFFVVCIILFLYILKKFKGLNKKNI